MKKSQEETPTFFCVQAWCKQREGHCGLDSWVLVLSWASEETCGLKELFLGVQPRSGSGPAPVASVNKFVCMIFWLLKLQ